MGHPLELILFENDVENARQMIRAGISSFLVDIEVLGKNFRQLGFDTEIRPGTWEQLKAISTIEKAKTWCRINRFGRHTANEIEMAIGSGARVVLLPMVTRLAEVESVLDMIGKRCQTGIMIETQEALLLAPQINQLPVDYAFFGLIDFAISRGGGSIFNALCDGSVATARTGLSSIRFGVGGLTDVHRGHPIPSIRLLQEFHRLGCNFTFLRRSFRRDSLLRAPAEIVREIHLCWQQCMARSEAERQSDHRELAFLIGRVESNV